MDSESVASYCNCLLCCSPVVDLASGEEGFAVNKNDTSAIIRKQVNVIFILRKILEIPGKRLEAYLKQWGSPEKWIKLCEQCITTVEQAEKIFEEMLKAERNFRECQLKIVENVKVRVGDGEGGRSERRRRWNKKEKGQEACVRITEECQGFVRNYDYRHSRDQRIGKMKTKGSLSPLGGASAFFPKNTRELVPESVDFKALKTEEDLEIKSEPESEDNADLPESLLNVQLEMDKSVPNETEPFGDNTEKDDWNDNFEDALVSTDEEQKRTEGPSKKKRKRIGLMWREDDDPEWDPSGAVGKKSASIADGDGDEEELLLSSEDSDNIQLDEDPETVRKRRKKKRIRRYASSEEEDESPKRGGPRGPRIKKKFAHRKLWEKNTCHICNDKRKDIVALKTHLAAAHKLRNLFLVCPKEACNKIFTSESGLQTHVKRHDPQSAAAPPVKKVSAKPADPHVCELCGKQFSKKDYLQSHVAIIHENEKHGVTCDICGLFIPNPKNLGRHLKRIHKIYEEGEEELQCPLEGCKKIFFTKEKLEEHHRRLHEGKEKEFKCGICGKSFWYKYQQVNHEGRHLNQGKKHFECDICHKQFVYKDGLKTHMKRVHEDQPDLICKYCGKAFTFPGSLRSHEKRHEDGEVRPHKCDVCGKGYKTVHDLRRHKQTHLKLVDRRRKDWKETLERLQTHDPTINAVLNVGAEEVVQ